MVAVKLIARVALSLVLGWYSLIVPMWIAGFLGLPPWGFFHSGWVLLFLPLGVVFVFWLLGFIPFLRLRKPALAPPTPP